MEVYSYTLIADNTTEARVSLSDLGGGWLRATALLEGHGPSQSLLASLVDPETEQEVVRMKWTRRKGEGLFTLCLCHGYTSVLDMNTAQDGAKIWDKIHHEGKCVQLLWSSSGAKTELI